MSEPLVVHEGEGELYSNAIAAELLSLRAELEARNRRETAIAELGQAALSGIDPFILLGQVCALIEHTLQISHCRALEIQSGGQMIVRTALGTNPTFPGCLRDADEDEALAAAVLLSEGPFSFSDLESETRFRTTHLRQHHGVRSGAGVVIRTQYGPFGVILLYCDEARTFTEFELAFLRSVANILGEAIARTRTEQALRKSEARLRQLIATTLDAVVTVDRTMTVVEWNRQAEATFGIAAREALGAPLRLSLFRDRDLAVIRLLLDRYRSGQPRRILRRRIVTHAYRQSGESLPVEVTIAPTGSGPTATFTAFIRDISDRQRARHELETREKRFRTIVEKSWSGVVLLDGDLRFSFAGSSTQHLIGYDEHELLGRSLLDYVHPRDIEKAGRILTETASRPNEESHGELRFRHRDGRWIWLEGFTQNLLHEPSVGAIVLNYRDVSHRKETEKQLEYRAHYDSLTGLPNRLLFRDRLVNAIAAAQRNNVGVAVMYLDLDHFKLVNDGLGHTFGDLLLADVAQRLHGALRASDTISRIGGDEFSILLPEVSGTEAVIDVAAKVLESLAKPFHIEGHDLFVTASIGVSCYPTDGDDAETLLKCADAAMYRAKELGRNQVQLFTASMNERYVRRLALEQQLHRAIEREELELYYQPVYDRARRRIVSFEALLRWRDPVRGIVEPDEFIALAEDTGLIIPIGSWALTTACNQLREWQEQGVPPLRVAVNISPVQLQQRDFVDVVRNALDRSGVAPELLQLEITESAAMANLELTMKVLAELREMGVGVAVDDFGIGQSSLTYLKHLPIDTVKIDKSFLRDVTEDETAAAIVSYVINLAHTLRLKVVAEGVETEAQFSFLRHYACDLMQGYLFSRPLPSAAVVPYLQAATFRPPSLPELSPVRIPISR
jgi:diguanylate cyclase (GGDEF)-like protein/PAS domain S-box-containing protein